VPGWVLSIDEVGSRQAADLFDDFADRATHAQEFFRRVADLLMEQSRRRWNTEAGWSPLEPSTIARKARSKDARERANADNTLRATGALERALTVWGAPGQKYEVSSDELAFGIYVGAQLGPSGERASDVWYGAIHQGGHGVPKRQILKATPATRRRVADELRDYLFGRA
jgi:hypothetical protein